MFYWAAVGQLTNEQFGKGNEYVLCRFKGCLLHAAVLPVSPLTPCESWAVIQDVALHKNPPSEVE